MGSRPSRPRRLWLWFPGSARLRSRPRNDRRREGTTRNDGTESQAAGDEHLHDLVGAGIDAHHPRVAVDARDRKLLHVPVAAEELQAAVHDRAQDVREPVLGHGGGYRIESAVKVALEAVVVKHP